MSWVSKTCLLLAQVLLNRVLTSPRLFDRWILTGGFSINHDNTEIKGTWHQSFFFFFSSLSWPILSYFLAFVQLLSHVQLFATPWTLACQAPLSSTVSWSLLKFMFIELVMLPNHLILCCPFSFCLQFFSASGLFPISQFFTSGGQNIGASASAPVFPMNTYGWFPLGLTGLISLLVQGTLKSLLQHHSSKHHFSIVRNRTWVFVLMKKKCT